VVGGRVHVALNGGFPRGAHAALPVTLEELVADAKACQAAGASSVHLHPRRPADELESLAAGVCDPVVAAIRAGAPGLEISLSTAESIELDGAGGRIEAISAWRTPPDVVSLNLAESGSIELGSALLDHGIGIEAGVFELADAEALLAAPWRARIRRVLIETVYERDGASAVALAKAIDARVARLGKPRVWHGEDRATWAVVDAAIAAGREVRVGLEDTVVDPDGSPAPTNPEQVKRVLARARKMGPSGSA
jgi:uncharacterized protein (DUF849 family)